MNEFFQNIYGNEYRARYPSLTLQLDDLKLKKTNNPLARYALDPKKAIIIIKLMPDVCERSKNLAHISENSLPDKILQKEADAVVQITEAYFNSLQKRQGVKSSLFIVTPHHRQRCTIKLRLLHHISNPEIDLQIDTVERMQGKEAELVIVCFGFLDISEIKQESAFLFDFNRWNVAVSRAKCKVIVILTDEMLNPRNLEIFTDKKTSRGWTFLNMIENWVKKRDLMNSKSLGILEWK